MGLIGTLTDFSPNTTIVSADVEANFETIRTAYNSSAVLTDVVRSITVGHTFTVAQKFADGLVSAPGITFADDTDSGFYRIGANNIGVAVNGAKVLDVGTAGLGVTGTLSSTGALTVAAGGITVTAGGITVSAGTTAVQALTATTAAFSSTLAVTGDVTLSAALNLAATQRLVLDGAGGNTYITNSALDRIQFVAGGSAALTLNSGGVNETALAIVPDATNTRTLGTTSLRWSNVVSVAGNFSGAVTLGSTLAVTGVATFSGGIAGTLSTAAQPNITSLGTLTGLTLSGGITAAALAISGTLAWGGGQVIDSSDDIPVVRMLTGTITWNPGAVAAHTTENSGATTITGAAAGDLVIVEQVFDQDDTALICTGQVDAADSVSVNIHNLSAVSKNATERTQRIWVLQVVS